MRLYCFCILALSSCSALGDEAVKESQRGFVEISTAGNWKTVYQGEVIPSGSSSPAFDFEASVQLENDAVSLLRQDYRRKGTEPSQVLTRELARFDPKGLIEYQTLHRQRGYRASVTRSGRKLFFIYQEGKEPPRTSEETLDAGSALAVGPMIPEWIRIHWTNLSQRKRVPLQLAVLDRLETFGFEIALKSKETDEWAFELRPTSVIVRFVVEPITFRFNPKTKRLRSFSGQLPPYRREGDEWKSLEGLARVTRTGQLPKFLSL
jgi:hypothetical protein